MLSIYVGEFTNKISVWKIFNTHYKDRNTHKHRLQFKWKYLYNVGQWITDN